MTPIRSYNVTVKTTVLNEKTGAVESQTVVAGYPRIINATSADDASFTARYLMLRQDRAIRAAEGEDGSVDVSDELVTAISDFLGTTEVTAVCL